MKTSVLSFLFLISVCLPILSSETPSFNTVFDDGENYSVMDIEADQIGNIWIAFRQRKLAIIKHDKTLIMSNNFIGNDNGFSCLKAYKNGMLVGGANDGLWWMPDAESVMRFPVLSGIAGNTVFDIETLGDGRVLAITEIGLYLSEDALVWQPVCPELRTLQCSTIMTGGNYIFVGTYRDGVHVLDKKTLRVVRRLSLEHPVFDLLVTKHGLFIATSFGLYRYDFTALDKMPERVEFSSPVETRGDVIQMTWFSSITSDPTDNNAMYLACRDRGIFRAVFEDGALSAKRLTNLNGSLVIKTLGNDILFSGLNSAVYSMNGGRHSKKECQNYTPKLIKYQASNLLQREQNFLSCYWNEIKDVYYLGLDRTTRGNWTHTMPVRPFYENDIDYGYVFAAKGGGVSYGPFSFTVTKNLGIEYHKGDTPRNWWTGVSNDIDKIETYDSMFRYDGFLDDHGETVPYWEKGPDLNISMVPGMGYYIVSVYTECADYNYFYKLIVSSNGSSVCSFFPSLNGGSYCSFFVHSDGGPVNVYLDRNKSHNARIAAVFFTRINDYWDTDLQKKISSTKPDNGIYGLDVNSKERSLSFINNAINIQYYLYNSFIDIYWNNSNTVDNIFVLSQIRRISGNLFTNHDFGKMYSFIEHSIICDIDSRDELKTIVSVIVQALEGTTSLNDDLALGIVNEYAKRIRDIDNLSDFIYDTIDCQSYISRTRFGNIRRAVLLGYIQGLGREVFVNNVLFLTINSYLFMLKNANQLVDFSTFNDICLEVYLRDINKMEPSKKQRWFDDIVSRYYNTNNKSLYSREMKGKVLENLTYRSQKLISIAEENNLDCGVIKDNYSRITRIYE